MSPLEEDGLAGEAGRAGPRPLPIADLDLSLVERVRAATSAEAIEDYAAQIDHLPPIRVALVDDRCVVTGGLHRVRAYELAGRAEIPCIIEPMTWAEAVRAAVADNRSQGLRMTRADKRAAITLLLVEDPGLSSRAIAELVGCSHHTVEEARIQVGNLPTSPAGEVQVSDSGTSPPAVGPLASHSGRSATPRRGRDGKLYPTPARPPPVPSAGMTYQDLAAQEEYPQPAAPQMAPALLIDFRTQAPWVARYLRCVLRTESGGHRVEALDEVLAALTSEELRQLSRRAEEVIEARVSRPSGVDLARPTAH